MTYNYFFFILNPIYPHPHFQMGCWWWGYVDGTVAENFSDTSLAVMALVSLRRFTAITIFNNAVPEVSDLLLFFILL